MIVAGYAGVGKTVLAEKNPQKVLDFVSYPFKYFLDPDKTYGEVNKACLENEMQPFWPYNYVGKIMKIDDGKKLILIPSDVVVLNLLRTEVVPYILVYPRRESKDIYRRRFLERGNTEDFLAVFIDRWDGFMDLLERTPAQKRIVLESHQYLSDVIDVDSLLKED